MKPQLKCLIVNADDFGLSPGVNRGIIDAHERGVVTSTSLMVRYPDAAQAAEYAAAHQALSVGLHVDLAEWSYGRDGWHNVYEVVPVAEASAVAAEVQRQLARFRSLMGRDPTHLDSHQHLHRAEPLKSILLQHAADLGIILREMDREVRYKGTFYGQSNQGHSCPEGVSVGALTRILESLPPGVTELGCHPAAEADMRGMYRQERVAECQALCDPLVREAIRREKIVLCSFSDWRAQSPESSTR